ncbi:DUF1206 domain-containing protein [Pseudooceanicola sp. C21-150M6]|uniref:DUF1206 domain-containing protein n=1 Tax=Pseudooceanicola sp. C21-150M6 TaxID=3434355 RepID=UPI003D7FED82
MSENRAPAWVVPVMRTGYSARGGTYIVLGILTLLAAWTGQEAEGTKEALEKLRSVPFGYAALWGLSVGLMAYCIWRLIDAAMDLEDYGSGAKGVVARGGQVITGLIHAGLSISAARLAMGRGNGEGDSAQSAASWVLQQPYGKVLIMIVGAVVICTGAYYAWKGIDEKYKEHVRQTRWALKLDPVIKAGLVAHGLVIALIGVFLIYAGLNSDPSQAGGIGKAFQTVRSQPYGQALLAALAVGMLGFAVYCFVEAVYRVLPARNGGDVKTLATHARMKAERLAHGH